MDRDRQKRVEELFQAAIDKAAAEREDYLHREEPDESIRTDVLSLIGHHDVGAELFDLGSGDPEPDPERIGPFQIVSRLGQGGMGVVYLAEQTEPVRRTVALKLVRAGISSEELLRRFATEQEALARLEHPNVARLYEAGQTEDGQPFFAMEYVDGPPITQYCDERRIPARQRIELLAQAFLGVQEAHQNGIIHRDLKPSNILVTERDGVAIPKIIDFGVAKALSLHENQAQQFTRFGQLVGTPEYMSPEQAAGLPVDTRSDVYSLGVVLYELLAGVLPLDASSIREAGFEAMMRMIRESEPSRPSTRVSTLGDAGTDAARRRGTNPRNLARLLRGELDWITLRALEKERDQRYATVAEFAADLQAHLSHEPVRARPSTFAYRLRKFARRNRMAVSLASVAAVALLLFAAGMGIQAQRIANERDRANQESAVAEEVKAFLVELFRSADPNVAQGDSITVRTLLERGVERAAGVEDLRIRAELMSTLADVWDEIGSLEQALELSRRAYEAYVALDGPHGRRTLVELNNLGYANMRLGHNAVAESLYVECVEGWRAAGRPKDPEAVGAVQNLAQIQIALGRYDRAEEQLREAIALRLEVGGPDDPNLFPSRAALADVLLHQERHEEALEIELGLLTDRRRVHGENHPETIKSLKNLAFVYLKLDRSDDAGPLLREAEERGRRVLGEDHAVYQSVRSTLAYLHFQRGEYAEAEPFFKSVAEARVARFGPDHANSLISKQNLGSLYAQWGRVDEADRIYREILDARLRNLGEEHPQTQTSRYLLAMLAMRQSDSDRALDQLGIAVENGLARPDLVDLDEDSEFAGLIGNPEFERLRNLIRARLEER